MDSPPPSAGSHLLNDYPQGHQNQPQHQTQRPLPPLPGRGSTSTDQETDDLVPAPLFSKRIRRLPPLTKIHVAVFELAPLSPMFLDSNTAHSNASSHSSAASSLRSRSSSVSSTVSSISSSPTSISSSTFGPLSAAASIPPFCWSPVSPSMPWSCYSVYHSSAPPHPLRRKSSPKRDTLRRLREKESEACLQRIYDAQTLRYLEGSLGVSAGEWVFQQ